MKSSFTQAITGTPHSCPTIGVLAGWQTYSGTVHSFLDYVYRGIRMAAQQHNVNILIGGGIQSPASTGFWSTALPLIAPEIDFLPVGPWNTDGLIIIAPVINQVAAIYFQSLIQEGFPVVYAGGQDTGPTITVDNEGGILQAFDHLVEHGHRDIAFIAGHSALLGDTASRLNGYRMGLARHGFAYDPDLVEYGQHVPIASSQAMQKILARHKHFSAVIASNDDAAVGVMDALRQAGLSVPQDVAVIGFDDRLEARAQIPLLTTVRYPMFEMGFQSVNLLSQIIQGEIGRDSVVRIPTTLIVRESCGCLPGAGLIHPTLQPSSTVPTSEYTPTLVERMTGAVYKEMQQIGRAEVAYLCSRLLDTFVLSLQQNDPAAFRQAIQQILEHVARTGDDLYAWQGAISVIREGAPALLGQVPYSVIDPILHQARIAISEVARGQYARRLVHQTAVAQRISQMTARFFAATSAAEIFTVLGQNLESLGIHAAAVALYQPIEPAPAGEPDETTLPDLPFTWSYLAYPSAGEGETPSRFASRFANRIANRFPSRFLTRQFPPDGLFAPDHPYQLMVLPLSSSEGALGYAAFAADDIEPLGALTSQLVAALRSIRLYEAAVDARRMAEEANYLKSRFLSIVSHELRTPLNLIYGLSNMMIEQSRVVNDQECLVNRKDLERIDIGAQHLESLIRDVLDLARSDLGQLKLVQESLDMTEVLQAVSIIGEQLAKGKNLGWQADIPGCLPRVTGDRARLRQIILNLVNNAIKFTEIGSIALSAQIRHGMVVVSVRDTGLGIPPDEQEVIFDEFRQSRRTTARGFGGMGLGLAICKRLVEMHHGQIGVASSGEEGAGSTFFIELPISDPHVLADTVPEDASASQRVLLLVKDPGAGERLGKHLQEQGFQVQVCAPENTCAWTKNLQAAPPDKLVIDQAFTAAYGSDILKIIKENPLTANIPVLFFQLQDGEDAGSLLDLNLLTKPLNAANLAGELIARGLTAGDHPAASLRPILVVDDDPGILDLHTRILATLAPSYPILKAKDGLEALALIRKERPSLVLLDLNMPQMDGFSVLEHMQADEFTRNIPVIILTSQVLTEEDMSRLNTGVTGLLSKGMYSTQETLVHISAALTRKHRASSETQHLVMKAIGYIHTHYRDPINRGNVAAYVGVSERHLARCFQQEVGLSPMTYLNRFRVNIAKSLLASGKLSITGVALEVGFASGGYFTRVFREEVGASPRDFARSCE